MSTPVFGNLTIGGASVTSPSSYGHWNTGYGAIATALSATTNGVLPTTAKITANGKMELIGEDADLVINGQSLAKTLQAIQDRMAILVPDPEKLEKFESLKKAYEHYKTLEALCVDETKLD